MSYLLNYSVWKKLFEQSTSTGGAIDFLCVGGAVVNPILDAELHRNHGYPLAKDTTPTDMHMYTVNMRDFAKHDFTKAVIGEKVKDAIIEFDGNRITNSGKIAIEWNAQNMNKTIKVSGNGALVLHRAGEQLLKIGDKANKTGVIVLELSAPTRYSNLWLINSFGVDAQSLIARQARIAQSLGVAMVVPAEQNKIKALPQLQGKEITPFKGNFDNNGAFGVITSDPETMEKTTTYPPQKSEPNDSLAPYYEKYKISDLIDTGNNPKPPLKAATKTLVGVINTQLNNLSTFLPQFVKESMYRADAAYVDRFIMKIQENIAAARKANNENKLGIGIRANLAPAVELAPVTKEVPPISDTTFYKSGK